MTLPPTKIVLGRDVLVKDQLGPEKVVDLVIRGYNGLDVSTLTFSFFDPQDGTENHMVNRGIENVSTDAEGNTRIIRVTFRADVNPLGTGVADIEETQRIYIQGHPVEPANVDNTDTYPLFRIEYPIKKIGVATTNDGDLGQPDRATLTSATVSGTTLHLVVANPQFGYHIYINNPNNGSLLMSAGQYNDSPHDETIPNWSGLGSLDVAIESTGVMGQATNVVYPAPAPEPVLSLTSATYDNGNVHIVVDHAELMYRIKIEDGNGNVIFNAATYSDAEKDINLAAFYPGVTSLDHIVVYLVANGSNVETNRINVNIPASSPSGEFAIYYDGSHAIGSNGVASGKDMLYYDLGQSIITPDSRVFLTYPGGEVQLTKGFYPYTDDSWLYESDHVIKFVASSNSFTKIRIADPAYSNLAAGDWGLGNYHGRPSYKSPAIGNGQISNPLAFDIPGAQIGKVLVFDYLESSEPGSDYIMVNYDGATFNGIGGFDSWRMYSKIITQDANKNVQITYRKDGSVSQGEDAVYVDLNSINIIPGNQLVIKVDKADWRDGSVASGRAGALQSPDSGGQNGFVSNVSTIYINKPSDNGSIHLDYKTSSEAGSDRFRTRVFDKAGTLVIGDPIVASGEVDWTTGTISFNAFPAGIYRIEIYYTKDQSINAGLDSVFYDPNSFTFTP